MPKHEKKTPKDRLSISPDDIARSLVQVVGGGAGRLVIRIGSTEVRHYTRDPHETAECIRQSIAGAIRSALEEEAKKNRDLDEFARQVRLTIQKARQKVERLFRQWDREAARRVKGAA